MSIDIDSIEAKKENFLLQELVREVVTSYMTALVNKTSTTSLSVEVPLAIDIAFKIIDN